MQIVRANANSRCGRAHELPGDPRGGRLPDELLELLDLAPVHVVVEVGAVTATDGRLQRLGVDRRLLKVLRDPLWKW